MPEYFVRHTIDFETVKLYREKLTEALKDDLLAFFVAREISEKGTVHFHLVLRFDGSPEKLRYKLKGFGGSVYISGKEVENKVSAIAYCMKDGDWTQYNMEVYDILRAAAVTRPKVSFEKALEDIPVTVDEKYIREVLRLHAEHNRRIYIQHVSSYIRMKWAKVDNDYVRHLAEIIYRDII